MTTLQFVEPAKAPKTQNILLYGPAGTGKTVGACSAPGPILVINAEGPDALRFAHNAYGEKLRELRFEGSKSLDEAFLYLQEGKDGEQTVVLDTIAEIYQGLVDEMAGQGRPSLQMYGDVNTKLERFIRALRDLEINVVLVAHEQVDDTEGEITRRPMTGGKKLPEKVLAQMSIVAYCGVIPATDEAPRRYVGQLVEANGRRAKDRSGALGDYRDLDLSEWIQIANAAKPTLNTDNGAPAAAPTNDKEAVAA